MNQMQPVGRGWHRLDWTIQRPIDRLTGNFCWPLQALVIIFLVPFFLRRHCTNQLQMEKSLWTACVRKISCLALKLTRYNVKKIKKFLLIDEKCIFFFFLTIWDLCLLVMLLVINFSVFCVSGFGSSTRIKQWIVVPRLGWIGIKIHWILQARCSIC